MSERDDAHPPRQGDPTEPTPAPRVDGVARARPARAGIADGVERPVDPASVTVSRIGSAIAAALLLAPAVIGAGIVQWLAEGVPGVVRAAIAAAVVVLAAVLAWATLVLPALRFRRLRYRLDAHGLGIRRGIWWRSDARVPRSRVQHTDVTQGPIERAFGLATLVVFTAGTEHARIELQGLAEPRAREIRDDLVTTRDDDGV